MGAIPLLDPSPPPRRHGRRRRRPAAASLASSAALFLLQTTYLHTPLRPAAAFSAQPPSDPLPPSTRTNSLPFDAPMTAEECVQHQLACYHSSDLAGAYACCSPSNQNVTGSLQAFEEQLHMAPYDLIVGHERADVLLEVRPDGVPDEESGILDVACCLVRIRPGKEARRKFPVWFWWEVTKLRWDVAGENDGTIAGETISGEAVGEARSEGKWTVDCVVPDFDDLDFETEALSIDNFMDDDEGDDDELTIYWDMDE